jgi:tetratricopeptide (TPR) repeat protein
VQQEVVRRETEVGRALQEAARHREALSQVQSVLGPFTQNINATGGDAISMVQSLFQADHTLRHGSQAEKAQLAANIIKNYGVDLRALDSILAGQALPEDPNAQLAQQLRRELQQTLQPVLGYFNQVQGQRQQAVQQISASAANEVEGFGQDQAHEFFDHVREDMADIIDMYTARGQVITLQDAYDRAINFNPQIREVVAKRAEQGRANAAAQAAQRARRTAVSLSSAPAPAGAVPGPAGDDRRAAIAAAWGDSESS